MARLKISKEAQSFKGFSLMEEGEQIIEVTEVSAKPAARPKIVSIKAKNEAGDEIRNRWDVSNPNQEKFFWMFYNKGCGLDTNEDGEVDPNDMLGCFANITVVHNTQEARTVVDEDTGEVKEFPARTFANFGYINGNEPGFAGSSATAEEDDGEGLFD